MASGNANLVKQIAGADVEGSRESSAGSHLLGVNVVVAGGQQQREGSVGVREGVTRCVCLGLIVRTVALAVTSSRVAQRATKADMTGTVMRAGKWCWRTGGTCMQLGVLAARE